MTLAIIIARRPSHFHRASPNANAILMIYGGGLACIHDMHEKELGHSNASKVSVVICSLMLRDTIARHRSQDSEVQTTSIPIGEGDVPCSGMVARWMDAQALSGFGGRGGRMRAHLISSHL